MEKKKQSWHLFFTPVTQPLLGRLAAEQDYQKATQLGVPLPAYDRALMSK